MKITKETYEAYMLDLLDGTISKQDEMELMLFIEQHPELKEDIGGMGIHLSKDDWIVFDDKDSLRKIVDYDRFSDLTIEEIEGEISPWDKKDLDSMLELQPTLKKDYQLFQKTVLPKEKIIFPFKEDLKKEVKVLRIKRSWVTYATAIAASLTLILVINTGEKPVSVYKSSPGFTELKNQDNSDELGALLNERLKILIKEEEGLSCKTVVEPAQNDITQISFADGDTSEFVYEPIELFSTFNTNSLLKNKEERLAKRITEDNVSDYQNMNIIDRAFAIFIETKKEYIPDNYKDMSALEQIEYATNKIGQVTNKDISLNMEEGEGWSFQAGKFSISR